jgi:hypothetical protein
MTAPSNASTMQYAYSGYHNLEADKITAIYARAVNASSAEGRVLHARDRGNSCRLIRVREFPAVSCSGVRDFPNAGISPCDRVSLSATAPVVRLSRR